MPPAFSSLSVMLALSCTPYLHRDVTLPPLSAAPAQTEVAFLGADVEECPSSCEPLEDAVQSGLRTAFREELGWSLTVPTGCRGGVCVRFQEHQTCLAEGRAPRSWAVAARLLSTREESRGAWASDALFGAKSASGAIHITLWDPKQRVVLDHLVALHDSVSEDDQQAIVIPELPLAAELRSDYHPNTRGTNLSLAEETARAGMSLLGQSLRAERARFTLVFDESDPRSESAVELAEDGRLEAALNALKQLEPASASSHYNLGMVQLGLGDASAAQQSFEAAEHAGLRTGWSARYLRLLRARAIHARRFPHSGCIQRRKARLPPFPEQSPRACLVRSTPILQKPERESWTRLAASSARAATKPSRSARSRVWPGCLQG